MFSVSCSYMFHCLVSNGILFMCATESNFGKRLPYAFLAEVCFQLLA